MVTDIDPLQGAQVALWKPRQHVIEVRGADAPDWLQSMVPNDVLRLEAGHSARSMLLERTGRLRSLLRMARPPRGSEYWLLADAQEADAVLARLDRFVVMEDVELRLQEGWGVLALAGPEAPALAWEATAQEPAVHPVRAPRLTPSDVDLLGPVEALERVVRQLGEAKAQLLEGEGLDLARILAPDPVLGLDVTPEELPLEAGLRLAVSFTKGCYTGQEAVNKMAHRGRPRRSLVRLRLEGNPPPPSRGASITATDRPRPVGRLGTVARSARRGTWYALGVVHRREVHPDRELHVGTWRALLEEPVNALP